MFRVWRFRGIQAFGVKGLGLDSNEFIFMSTFMFYRVFDAVFMHA